MKETQEKDRVARVKEPVKAQVRVLDKGARALVRVARVKEQDKVQDKEARALVRVARVEEQDKVQDKEARETWAKVLVKVLIKKGISKKKLT